MLGLDHNPVIPPAALAVAVDVPPMPAGTLRAEAVPPAQKDQPVPVMRVLIPVIMVVAIGAVMALMALSGRGMSPMMLMFPLMMLVGMVAMFNPSESQGDIDETRRVYLRHLDALAARARANGAKQRSHMTYLHPAPGELATGVPTHRVWERLDSSPEALQVRVGTGTTALCTPVEVDDPGSPEDLDPVCAVSLRRTVAAVSAVHAMPIVVQLAAFPAVTLAGPAAEAVARAMLCQLAFFHGPELVGIDATRTRFGWAKWLPHTRAPEAAAFRIALIDASLQPTNFTTTPLLGADECDCVITFHPDPDFYVDEDALHLVCAATMTALTGTGEERLGVPDPLSDAEAALVARRLAFYRRPDEGAGETGADVLAMLGLDRLGDIGPDGLADGEAVTDADVAAMWPGREGTRQRLTVPIGATPEGRAVFLDIKEAAHGGAGPHGLCIGATGSGKSELLRTLVIALAATHSPDELNLVLVDFKGGATFLGCEGLPHTSAVITNLEDEAVLVERMYDALSGEMHRRQELLRKAGNYANITDYTAARLSGADITPLPALVVVVDEFSELLTQHPHFAELFVAIGRLGRSLGVHLLLASQRLEEGKLRGLDSHLSYRIGLKTFSAAESRQVLGVPDAYELPGQPGSGFLKAASPDLVRFRAAYVSGPLTRRVVQHKAALTVQVRPFTGWDAAERAWEEQALADDAETVTTDESTTVVDAVVRRTTALAEHAGMRAHQVWLPPLPGAYELHELRPGEESHGHLRIPVGIVDEPYHQRQDTALLDLAASGGHAAIAGGPQTGKSEALKTIVASLALTHTTDQVAVYAIDAGSGGLTDLEVLPHVAGVASRADEERVRRVVDEVTSIIDDAATASAETVRRDTLLIVDGWHALLSTDSKLEDLRDPLTRIASEGPAAGVHLLLTTQRWSAVRTGVRDLVATRLELGLTEPMDSLIDRTAQTKLPARPGIGLTPEAKLMLFARTSAQDLAHVAQVTADQPRVPALRVLPTHVAVEHLLAKAGGIPIGVGGPRLEPIACASGHLLAIGATGSGKSTVIASAIEAVGALPREEARMVILDPRRAHLGRAREDMVAFYAASASTIADAVRALSSTLNARLPGADVSPQQLAARSWWEGPELYLLIDDFDLVGDPVLRDVEALLPHARDVGLHVICARKFGGVSRALYGGFLGALKDLLPDVCILDGTREEGSLFGVRPSAQPPGRATLVQAGDVVGTVQLAAPYGEGGSL
ncbi:type VII secretion protein EccCa [Corynebacterium sp. TA-R-1]|uniref:Type VII secretion protein EccCa n=1 Tax=Corynebacterium stercoris TaxID=2943490 RepID=A0ABT1G1C0_9CORY|nr:type VII secretion protein EccCa [Corynebacterium stercoris]MCP1387822.1 type VII secretion protein EccCa [Corynebacterium stercoris]